MKKEENLKQSNKLISTYGFAVFPVHGIKDGKCTCGDPHCRSAGKHPIPANGFKSATKDIHEYERLLDDHECANIGIATGWQSNIVVIDVDDPTAETRLRQFGYLPDTLTSQTGRGKHFIFRCPEGCEIKSRTNFFEKIDIRAEGGYIVAPKSLHQCGLQYDFINPLEVIESLPDWLLKMLLNGFEKGIREINKSDYPDIPYQDITDMLSYLDPDMPHDDWVHVGMALHNGGYDVSLWDDWSSKGSKYQKGECHRKWISFNGHGVSMGTLVHMAQKAGFEFHKVQVQRMSNSIERSDADGFVSMGELMNNIGPPSWLIKDYVENHTLSLMFGDPASGKSFIAIDMACCVARGMDWHGRSVKQGAVFYIAGEGHNGLGRRFKAWHEHYNVPESDIIPVFVSKQPASFCDEEGAKEIAQTIETMSEQHDIKPAMIIIDTLARNFGGGDENSTRDMSRFIQNIDTIKNQWDATVMIVHHTGHADKSRGRGAMALKGALDQEYCVSKDDDNVVSFKCTKMKDACEPDPMYLTLETIELSVVDEDGHPATSAVMQICEKPEVNHKIKLSPQRQRALDIFRNCLIDHAEIRSVRREMAPVSCVTLEEYKHALRMANISTSGKRDSIEKAVNRAIEGLNDRGITSSYGDHIWLTDKSDKCGQT